MYIDPRALAIIEKKIKGLRENIFNCKVELGQAGKFVKEEMNQAGENNSNNNHNNMNQFSLCPIISQRIKNIEQRCQQAQKLDEILSKRVTELKYLIDNYDTTVAITQEEIRNLKTASLNSTDIYDKKAINQCCGSVNNLKDKMAVLKKQTDQIIDISREPDRIDNQIVKTTGQIQENVNLLDSVINELAEKSDEAIDKVGEIQSELLRIQDKLSDSSSSENPDQNLQKIRQLQLEIYKIKGASDVMLHSETSNLANNLLEKLVHQELEIKEKKNLAERKKNEENLEQWFEKIESQLENEENQLSFPVSSNEIQLASARHAALNQEIVNRKEEVELVSLVGSSTTLDDSQSAVQSKYSEIIKKSQNKTDSLAENLRLAINRENSLENLIKFIDTQELLLARDFKNTSGLPETVKNFQEKLEDIKFLIAEKSCMDEVLTDSEKKKLDNRVTRINNLVTSIDKKLNENLIQGKNFLNLKEKIRNLVVEKESAFVNEIIADNSPDYVTSDSKVVVKEAENLVVLKKDLQEEGKILVRELEASANKIGYEAASKTEVAKIEETVDSCTKDYQHLLNNVEERIISTNAIKEYVLSYEEIKEKLNEIFDKNPAENQTDNFEIKHLVKKLKNLAKNIKIEDFNQLIEKADKKMAEIDDYAKQMENFNYRKNLDEKKFADIKIWVDQTLAEAVSGSNDNLKGDVAMIRALMRQNRKNNDLLDQKKMIIEEMVTDDQCFINATDQNTIEIYNNCQKIAEIFRSRDLALIEALEEAENFESSINDILHWIQSTEKKLEHFQMVVDDNDFQSNIEQFKFEMSEITISQGQMGEEFHDTIELGENIVAETNFDLSKESINKWLTAAKSGWADLNSWIITLSSNLDQLSQTQKGFEEKKSALKNWLNDNLEILIEELSKPLPEEDQDELEFLLEEHKVFQEELANKKIELDKINNLDSSMASKNQGHGSLNMLWDQIIVKSFDRHRILQEANERLKDGFDYAEWQRRFIAWSKSRDKGTILDIFKKHDKISSGILTRENFANAIRSARFPTSDSEMKHVLNILDRLQKDQIDYYDFIMNLQKNLQAEKNANAKKESEEKQVGQNNISSGYYTNSEANDANSNKHLIEDEVVRQVAGCKCKSRYHLEKVAKDKYKFGSCETLRLVRILRSTVMVRVGGGWMSIDEFLAKNDPCRGRYFCMVIIFYFLGY